MALTRARWGLGKDELHTLQERAKFFSLDKEDNFLEFREKYLRAGETLKKQGQNGIIKVDLQLFAEKDLSKQKTFSLKKGLISFQEQIAEHRNKIANPQEYVPDWEAKDPREQEGLKRHWAKEIRNFQQSIDSRIAELKKRGEYDE